jgi:hypothetical protein
MQEAQGLTTGGWITMILSVGFVVSLFVTCISKVILGHKPVEPLHGVDNIEPPDIKEEAERD